MDSDTIELVRGLTELKRRFRRAALSQHKLTLAPVECSVLAFVLEQIADQKLLGRP
jgi:hypothetical protein